jgi:hypothetical protein
MTWRPPPRRRARDGHAALRAAAIEDARAAVEIADRYALPL